MTYSVATVTIASCSLSQVQNVSKKPMGFTGASGLRLEAVLELSVCRYSQLARSLHVGPLLRLRRLVEDLQFRVLVLQHSLLAGNARLQLENRLLIIGARDGVDQLLNGRKAAARVGERLARQALQQRNRLTFSLQLRGPGRGERRELLGCQQRIRSERALQVRRERRITARTRR